MEHQLRLPMADFISTPPSVYLSLNCSSFSLKCIYFYFFLISPSLWQFLFLLFHHFKKSISIFFLSLIIVIFFYLPLWVSCTRCTVCIVSSDLDDKLISPYPQVSPSLIKRRKTHFHQLPCGASVILGNNGFVWIYPTR
jgi:hypothetical protein